MIFGLIYIGCSKIVKILRRGYDVVVACNLAKVDVPVQFRLPAPHLFFLIWACTGLDSRVRA